MRFFEPPPSSLIIDGKEYPIDTDFRTWIKFQQIITKKNSQEQKTADLLQFIAALGLPFSENTLNAMVDFFRAGDIPRGNKEPQDAIYNFETDGSLIFSAFLTQYQCDLTLGHMHWWIFKSMFSGLSDEHMITKVMWARSANKAKMSKEMREYAEALCEAYPLERKEKMTLEERNQKMRDYIAKRYEETKKSNLPLLRGDEQPGND